MIYPGIFRFQPIYGQLIKNSKSKLCILNENVKLRVLLNRPNSNLTNKVAKAESINSKANQVKDKLLFYYENPQFYITLNGFAFVQFFFWMYMTEFTINKAGNIKIEINEFSPWWRKFNFEDESFRKKVASLTFLIGYSVLALSWIYTLRSVRMLVLLKDNKTVSIVTYGPFNRNRYLNVPLENISANFSRSAAKSQLPLKVKGKWFHYILDMKDGKFQNPDLFDRTAGMKRRLK